VIDAVRAECVAVKPQLACFERLGVPGWEALSEVVGTAQAAGLLVIADAKRGDIDVSARAYAQALIGDTPSPFGTIPGLGADAVTVSPWLGADSLAPFTEIARERGRGIFVLVRNSNPGAVELQDRPHRSRRRRALRAL
jgi:orotidine-5'-phosphate decarboxylase